MRISSSKKRIAAQLALFLSVQLLIPVFAFTDTEIPRLYYARFIVISRNGMIVESKLELQPTNTEYRMEGFECIRAIGIADPSAGLDVAAAARHDAITRLLTVHGLKSISASARLLNALPDDRVQMSHEGLVRYPFRILDERFENGVYRFDLEVEFSPLSFPDRWSYLALKYRLRETFAQLLHVFI